MPYRRFAKLRWKLALAYTVTTAAVLTVLGLLSVVAIVEARGTRAEQGRYVTAVLQQLAVRAAPLLATEPVDRSQLSVMLITAFERSGIGQPSINLNHDAAADDLFHESGALLLALDRRQQLLASTGLSGQILAGHPFDTASVPGLDALLADDLGQQYLRFDQETNQALVVVSIEGDRRLGTLVYMTESLAAPQAELGAVLATFSGPIASFIGAATLIGLAFGLITAHGLTRHLGAIAHVTAAWGGGDFAPRLADSSADEVGQLASQLNGVADQLQALIRERQQFATFDERNRLARDLHDSVKQHIFAATMNLGAAQELWQQDGAAAAALTKTAASATTEAQRELTDIIQALRPPELERTNLAQALIELAAYWSAQTGIAIRAESDQRIPIPPAIEHALFRIAQEALANVARHSGAQAAVIGLWEEQGGVTLRVQDNGRGFDPATALAGLGLRSMRERADAISAILMIHGNAQGAELVVKLPIGGATCREQ